MRTCLNISYLPEEVIVALRDLCIYKKYDRIVEPFAGTGIISYLFDIGKATLNDPVKANIMQINTLKCNPEAIKMYISQMGMLDLYSGPVFIDPNRITSLDLYLEALEYNRELTELNDTIDKVSEFLNKSEITIEDLSPMQTLRSLRRKDLLFIRCAELNPVLLGIIKDSKAMCVILSENDLNVEGYSQLNLNNVLHRVYYNF